MSALRDLLAIETALGSGMRPKEDLMTRYLMKQLKKMELKLGGDKKKEEEKKKGQWTVEDRICLGLIMAFAAVPLVTMYSWALRSLVR